MSSSHYESAAKDLEQEKKMVAALKRLSIGNRMNYDPDLPPEESDFLPLSEWEKSPSPPKTSPQKLLNENAEINEVPDNVDTHELLWVPAKMHPEVDPELFKLHVKNAVEEIMERKLTRKLSRRSSLLGSPSTEISKTSAPSTPESSQNQDTSPSRSATHTGLPSDPRKRFSNPSLHQLSSELENLSRRAGMDANDAVTLARTLSSSSLGYTNSERLAIDELTLPPRSREPSYREPGAEHAEEFPLKRSRRLDYRKNTVASGTSLQNNKAGKLAELRSNLNSALQTTVPSLHSDFNVPKVRSKHRRPRNNRDSQTLFSYRNPNEKTENPPLEAHSSQRVTSDSPYLTASSSSSIERHFTPTYHPQYRRLILGSLTLPYSQVPSPQLQQTSKHKLHRRGSNNEYRPRQAPPPQPRGQPGNRRVPTPPQSYPPGSYQGKPTPQVTVVDTGSPVKSGLNKNLDLLRSEINEFKESLSTRTIPGTTESSDSSDNNESDFSFEASYQDVSYEDSLGIELEVLRELQAERETPQPPLNQPFTKLSSTKQPSSKQPSTNPPTNQPFTKQPSTNPPSFHVQVPASAVTSGRKETGNESKNLNLNRHDAITPLRLKNGQWDKTRADTFNVITSGTTETNHLDEDHGEQAILKRAQLPVIKHSEHPQDVHSLPEKENFRTQPHPESKEPQANDPVEELVKISEAAPKKRTLKKKKSWPWMRDRSASLDENTSPTPNPPSRSVSTPEITDKAKRNEVKKSDSKELKTQTNDNRNMISKLFRKKKTVKQSYTTNGVTVDYESDSDSDDKKLLSKKKKSAKKKLYTNLLQLTSSTLLSEDEQSHGVLQKQTSRGSQRSDNSENIATIHEVQPETPKHKHKKAEVKESKSKESDENQAKFDNLDEEPLQSLTPTKKSKDKKDTKNLKDAKDSDREVPSRSQTTLDVQEKIKKSIKRTSKANQPIEFTDSAFGFPLPPPSQSTLVMLDYRFPVHVERAIYRLSHLKLANPKRSLAEQVLLSNFMYAYLNLVDHTLHLEMAEELQGEIDLELGKEPEKLESDDVDDDTVMIDLDVVDG